MPAQQLQIRGRVVDRATQEGVAGLRVEAWDRGGALAVPIVATTGPDGAFDLAFGADQLREVDRVRQLRLSFRVYRDETLLRDTGDAVTWTWATRQQPVLIEVRAATDGSSPAGDGVPVPAASVVRGRLTQPDGRPIANATVRAFDRELRAETPLGEVTTDAGGRYEIHYTRDQLNGTSKRRADLVVRAYGHEGKEIASSKVVVDAPDDVTIDLVRGNEPYRGPSEFTRVRDALAPALGSVDLADLTAEEIAYLADKTNLDTSLIDRAVAAARLAQQTKLPPAVCYGLLREGMPADPAALLRRDRRTVLRRLEAAVAANVVSRDEVDPEQVRAAIDQAVVDRAFEPPETDGAISLGDLLATTSLSREQQEHLVRRAVQHEGSRSEFWDALRSDPALGDQAVADIQFSLQVGQISGYHLPLVQHLQARRHAGEIASTRDLARLDQAAWERILTTRHNGAAIGAPPGMPGETERERIQHYASALTRAFERLHPTVSLSRRLATAADPTQQDLVHFLDQNPDFDLGVTSIPSFIPRSNLTGIADVAQLTGNLKGMQRIYRLVPAEHRLDGLIALNNAGLSSARGVVRYGRDRFISTFAQSVGGVAVAKQIFDNASHTSAAAHTVLVKYGTGQFEPWVVGQQPGGSPDIPTWEELFGSLTTCACEHCRSVYSPAAYLVDLLAFLDQYEVERLIEEPRNARPTALTRLLQRRPDLGTIELTCANTDTLMPYVDLAIEIFEDAVAGERLVRQTTWTTEELNANAEHVNATAYDRDHLAGSVYPFDLPFNLWLEESRIYLEHLGMSLYQLLDTLHAAVTRPMIELPSPRPFPGEMEPEPRRIENRPGPGPIGDSPEPRPTEKVPDPRPLENEPRPGPIESRPNRGPVEDKPGPIENLPKPAPDLEPVDLMLTAAVVRAGEYLRLTPLARDVIAGETEHSLAALWGLDGKDPVAELKDVPTFLKQSGLSYDGLIELLSTRYVNPVVGTIVIERPDVDPFDPTPGSPGRPAPGPGPLPGPIDPNLPDIPVNVGITVSFAEPCTLEGATLNRLDDEALDRIHRFLRLQRALGWTFGDLDRVLVALGATKIDALFLVRLAAIKRLLDRFGLPLEEQLTWWGNIATTNYPGDLEPRSLYERLFLNNAVLNPVDPAFVLNAKKTELRSPGKLSEHVPTLISALGISAEELDLLVAAEVTDDTLNLATLSRLYRVVSLARALGLSIADFLSVRALSGVNPFDPSRIDQTERFVEIVDAIRSSAFTVAELDYLLRNEFDPGTGVGLGQDEIRAALETLRLGLSQIAREYAPVPDPTGAILAGTLALLLPAEVVPEALAIVAGESSLDPAQKETFVQTYFAPFLDPADAVAKLVDSTGLTQPQARYQYVLDAARRHLAHVAAEVLIAKQVAADFGLELAVAQALLAEYLPATLTSLLGLAEATDPVDYQAAARAYLLLHKVALALEKLGAGLADLPWLFGDEYAFGWYDVTQLPVDTPVSSLDAAAYRRWERLVGAFQLRDRFPGTDPSLFDVLAAGYTAASVDEVWNAVATLTGWDREDVATLAGPEALVLRFPVDYRDERYLLRLEQAFALLGRIGMPAEEVVTWTPTDDVDAMRRTAQSIKQAARSKYDDATWLTIAPPLRDVLREKQREALVSYLVSTTPGIERPSDLFARYLIDPEMDACMDTSRIKQAISSVQLFVQRCLMGLEPIVQLPAEAAAQWEWMKQYRVWEAARKVFLQPENYIEPDLRDDATSFFRDFANELGQGDLTNASAETALRNYLAKIDLVDRLQVRSLYHQLETAVDGTSVDRLHVLARTESAPYAYFYRQRVDDAYWTGWEPVNVSVAGSHEFLASHAGVLYLFMPTLELDQSDGREMWTVRLQWSTYRQGQWTPPREAAERLVFEAPRTENDAYFYFKTVKDGENLLIIPLWHEDGEGSSFTGDDFMAFRVRCGEKVDVDVGPFTYTIELPPDTRLDAMALVEDPYYVDGSEPLALFWSESAGPGDAGLPNQDDVTILRNTPGEFRIVLPHQYDYFNAQDAFFYHGITRAFFVKPTWWRFGYQSKTTTIGAAGRLLPSATTSQSLARHDSTSRSIVIGSEVVEYIPTDPTWEYAREKKLRFFTFHHPYLCDFIERLDQGGVPSLLQRETQSQSMIYFENLFNPNTDVVDSRYPIDEVEFAFGGAFSVYNEELFFHAPFLIAERLRQNQCFADAQRWYHYIFNPVVGTDGSGGPERFWVYYPFYRETVGETTLEMMLDLAAGDWTVASQVEQWRKDPFNPHAVARLRPQAYQKAVVMKYVQNLIDWGDQLFALDTIESINEATQLYLLAADILGDRPEQLPAVESAPKTFNDLRENLDAFSNALVEIENYIAEPDGRVVVASSPTPTLTLYFGIPTNDQLLALWDTVADRLFKIRHCMNIQGVARQLPLWEPPIEPGLLVRAAALGVDLSSVLADLYAPLPQYRFQVMLQKALEFCGEVRSLGATLLSALEKKDAEALALLRAGQEVRLLEAIRQVREWQVNEAEEARQALERTREIIAARQEYFTELLAQSWNEFELNEQKRLEEAHVARLVSQGFSVGAASLFIAASVPKGVTLRPGEVLDLAGKASQATAQAFDALAGHFSYRAALNAVQGGHERRKAEWKHQVELATKELEQIDKQILAAQIRKDIAQRELQNHDTQIANAQAVRDLMQNRFSNEALFGWMISQIAPSYFTSYSLAYDLAKRAERAFRHELALTESSYIGPGYWDSLRQGLLAGERLASDLRRMEAAYLDANKREYEITKHVSLAMLDPIALINLKESGECFFSLPEAIFDLDFPGHYLRRIKSISLTIPCVAGPYASVSCTLTLLGNRIRRETSLSQGYAYRGREDSRFQHDVGVVQSIATSGAQQDSGLFELSFRDERYLPFEGAGAISDWRLELPKAFRLFDYGTISDVIIHVHYTARDGGAAFREAVETQLATALNSMVLSEAEREGLDRLFSLRHEFPNEWHALRYPASANPPQSVTLPLSVERFPYPFQTRSIVIDSIELFVKVSPEFADSLTGDTLKISLVEGSAPSDTPLTVVPPMDGLLRAVKTPAGAPGEWTLAIWQTSGQGGAQTVPPEAIDEIYVVCHYRIS